MPAQRPRLTRRPTGVGAAEEEAEEEEEEEAEKEAEEEAEAEEEEQEEQEEQEEERRQRQWQRLYWRRVELMVVRWSQSWGATNFYWYWSQIWTVELMEIYLYTHQ